MKIVPVIDILNSVAVHAVRGVRKEYKPLKSVLSASSDPVEVAITFSRAGFGELYVADLNAITGNQDNLGIVKQIAEKTGLQVMVDAGANDITKAKTVMHHGAIRVIIGTETLTNISFVEEALRELGTERVVVSLDMKNGKVLRRLSLDKFPSPIDFLREFERLGVKQFIMLDLGRVGSEEGVDRSFLREVLERVKLDVFVGGGVRNMDDLLTLNEMGVSGVLLATALHSGKITMEQIVTAGLSLK